MPDPVLIINPRNNPRRHKRRRKAKRRAHSRRRRNPSGYFRRRSRRRNPRVLGMSLNPMAVVRGTIVPAAIGGVGAVGLDIALAYLPIPDTFKSGLPATLTKLIAAIGLGWLAGKAIGSDKGRLITLGAVTVMGYQFIRDQAKAALPTVKGLGGYSDYVDYRLTADRTGVGALDAYMAPGPARLGYMSPAPVLSGLSGMGAYMSPDLVPSAGAGMGDWSDGM